MKPDAPLTTSQNEVLDVARANALFATLGRADRLKPGDALPPFFHQIYFWDAQPPDGLGRDGHPRVGGVIPDMGLPRRMWAGGRLTFHAPLRVGQEAQKVTCCEASRRTEGRSGPLGFVTLRHEIWQDGQHCVTEHQDLVYREDPDPDAPRPVPPEAPQDTQGAALQHFDPTMLFRYSALTFNGHRIHYDRPYAQQVEGYGGLVVHGPLLAQLLMLKAQADLGPLEHFQFRATAPLLDTEAAQLCRSGSTLWVRAPDGRQCMQAQCTPAKGT